MIAHLLFFSLVLLSISVNGQCPAGQFVDGRWCCNCDTLPNCRQVTCRERGNSRCAKCRDGYVVNSQGKCVQDCRSTEFWDSRQNQCCDCPNIDNCVDRSCSGRDRVVCESCRSGYELKNNQCVKKVTCVSPQFYDAQYNQCCECPRIDGCVSRSCTRKDNVVCNQCQNGFVLINNQCKPRAVCREGQYYKSNTNECIGCPRINNCGTTICADANSPVCIRCASGYLRNGRCEEIPDCKAPKFYDEKTNTCQDCTSISNCLNLRCTCKSSSVCTQCRDGFVLKDNQCVSVPTCRPPTFYHPPSNCCRDCPAIFGCAERRCKDASSSTCDKCVDGYVLRNNQCQPVPTCNPPTFYDAGNNVCRECTKIENCASLSCSTQSNSVCRVCRDGYVLRNGQCIKIPSCFPPTYYDAGSNTCPLCPSIRDCQSVSCSSPSSVKCNACNPGYLLKDGRCVQIIQCSGSTWYDAQTNTCQQCAPFANCAIRTCTNGGSSTCNKCEDGFVFINGRCAQKPVCKPGSFYDAALNICCDCVDINNCADLTCSTKTSSVCIRCASGFVLKNNKCEEKPNCGTGTWYDADWNKCTPCSSVPNCASVTCTSRANNVCDRCLPGFFLRNNQCVQNPTCVAPTFLDTETNTCAPCTAIANCRIVNCQNKQSSTCGGCLPGFFLTNNKCVPIVQCTGATFLDSNTNTCPECPAFANCRTRTCSNSRASVCQECATGFILRNGQCVSKPVCTGATFYDPEYNFCCACSPIDKCEVLTCQNKALSTCVKCAEGYVLRNNRCVAVPKCTGATFYDATYNFCCDCTPIPNCVSLSCTSKASSTCSACEPGYLLKDGKCEKIVTCAGTTYYNAATNTCPECPAVANCASRTCQAPGTSSTCSACLVGFVLRNGVCELIPKCVGSTFYDEKTNTCPSCSTIDHCAILTCDSATSSVCSGCVDGFVLRNGVCKPVPVCTGPTFLDVLLNICCDCTPIDNCAALTCASKTASVCTDCKPGFVLRNNQCIEIPKCTAGTFYDPVTISCPVCSPLNGCKSVTCTSPSSSQCEVCQDGFFKRQTVCEPVVLCTDRQFRDEANNVCKDCTYPAGCSVGKCAATGLTCTGCDEGFVLIDGVCVDIPDCTRAEFYTKSDNKCHPCNFPANCKDGSCTSATDAVCRVCETGFTLIDKVCQPIPSCTTTQFYKKETNQCIDCPLKPNCAKGFCSDSETLFCTQCKDGYVNMLGVGCVKVPECKSTQFLDTVLNVCKDCTMAPNCVDFICTNEESTVCIKCAGGFAARGDACSEIPDCPPGSFLDMETLTCPKCPLPANCQKVATCTKAVDAKCSVCNAGFTLKNGVCVEVPRCVAPKVLDPVANVCSDCTAFVANCASALCSQPDNAVCTKCKPGFNNEDGECIPGKQPPPPAGSGSGEGPFPTPTPTPAYSFSNAEGTASATETTTVSQDGSGATTVTTSSEDNGHGFAIAVGVFAGVCVALLITLVVVVVMRPTQTEQV